MFLYGFEGGCGFFAAFHEDVGDAGEEEDGEDEGVEGGGVVAFLDEPPVVDDAGDGGDVDEGVEELPVFSAHGAEEGGWGGDGEGVGVGLGNGVEPVIMGVTGWSFSSGATEVPVDTAL